MKCPHCNKELQEGDKREYETLADHVLDPNMESYPLRPTWVCDCADSAGMFWDMTGDVYVLRMSHYTDAWDKAKDAIS